MSKPVIILGVGGHAKVLIDALRLYSTTILGATDADPAKEGQTVLGVPVLGDDAELGKHATGAVLLVNGIGAVRVHPLRRQVFERYSGAGYQFANVVHPSAIVAQDVVLEEGAQVMAGVVIQPGSRIGRNAVINSGAVVDHDCTIESHVHVAPGATLSGNVRVGAGAHVGTGATVIQGISIGRDSLVAAGAVVNCDVPDGATVAGVPAREMKATT